MNFEPIDASISLRRIAGMSTAMILHVGVVLFLVTPVRPSASTHSTEPVVPTFVELGERPIPPPPPPPPEQPPPPKPVVVKTPDPRREPVPVVPQTAAVSSTDIVVTDAVLTEYAEIAPESATPTSVGASVDAAYGGPPKVDYPTALIRKRLEGDVLLRVDLDAQGLVLGVSVARSSGHRQLDQSARDQVRRWRFRPAEENGSPIASSVLVPVSFRIDQS
ncbi:MAG: energy transducer TonB [Ahniella sp.]|nr:energy transducer TonB [Ahniella sp.]